VLREVASGLAFLHKHDVCVGDISPKNLLFSLTPHETIYFIDCDAVRINGVSVLPQVETPGWQAPAGEELATIYTDTYKLGLLALRLIVGDHDTTNPAHLPATTPDMLRQIITDTLTSQPQQRPLPEAWTYVLGNAIETAQHNQKTAATAQPNTPLAPPPTPVVHSRPSTPQPKPPPPPRAADRLAPPPQSAPPPSAPAKQSDPEYSGKMFVGVTAAIVSIVAVIAISVGIALHDSAASSQPSGVTATSAISTTGAVPDVRVYNNSGLPGAAGHSADQLKANGFNITEVDNLQLPNVTATTVYYGNVQGERETAEAVGRLLGASVEPRIVELRDQPPGVIVVVTDMSWSGRPT